MRIRHPGAANRVSFEIKFDQNHRFPANHPAVVSWLDRDNLRRLVFDDAAVLVWADAGVQDGQGGGDRFGVGGVQPGQGVGDAVGLGGGHGHVLGEGPRPINAEHPAVRTHPETGRRALYVNVAHTSHFKGMTEEESAPILQYLFAHQVKPEFTCRFAWRPGSLAFWDNRAAQHNPVNDYQGYRRIMRRITLAGDTPR